LILVGAASLAFAADYHMSSLKQLVASPYGGRVAWSPGANNLIAYDSMGPSGFYDVWTMNPDGSGPTCLTCNWEPTGGSQTNYNKGNPDWDPTGNYLVIQVQRSDTTYGATGNQYSRPGLGEDNVLYIMDAAGQHYWPVPASATFQPHNGGVLHPHFSHGASSQGVMLIWAQETSDGVWEIQQASFTVVNGVPSVTLLQTLAPGAAAQCAGAVHPFYETHGFSLDDSTIFFSGNPSEGCAATFGYDVYSYNLNTQTLSNLTDTPAVWEEHSQPSPVEEKLIYISSFGLDSTASDLLLEYWTMNYDGSDKKKITWITDPRGAAFSSIIPGFYIPGSASVGDSDWSHDGTQSVVYLIDQSASGTTAAGETGSIWLLTLTPSSFTASSASYLNYPQAPSSIALSFGSDLANGTYAATFPLGANLGGTTVSVEDSQGTSRAADLFFADTNQVNWQVPPGTAPGPAILTNTSGDGTVTTDIFDVENVGPGLYSVDASGAGPAAAYIYQSNQLTYRCAVAYSCTTVPVTVSGGITYLILYGTGVEHHVNPVTVNITDAAGNVLASPLAAYAGAQGAYTGLDQINVLLPASLAGAGVVNVSLTADGMTSNSVQVQIQ
jgi:uncharacterized protein (TIGR03437 family)